MAQELRYLADVAKVVRCDMTQKQAADMLNVIVDQRRADCFVLALAALGIVQFKEEPKVTVENAAIDVMVKSLTTVAAGLSPRADATKIAKDLHAAGFVITRNPCVV